MTLTLRQRGDFGELAARTFLEKKGMIFVEQNYHSRHGEIDLVMKEGGDYVFVEVKLRKNGHGEDSVTYEKEEKILRTIWDYFDKREIEGQFWRVDIVSIEKEGNGWYAYHFLNVVQE
jgi:putative endonuclease